MGGNVKAGGGVNANGTGEVTAVTIDPKVVDPEDVETLQDLLVGAFGDALRGPEGATTVAGGLPSGVRVRAADGELYAQRGANWQHLASGIEVLAVQQGSPR